MVLRSPFSGTFGQWKILIAYNSLNAGGYQIRTHIRKVGVPSVIIFQTVSRISQTSWNRRKFVRLFGIFHNAGAWLSGITTDDGSQPTIGTEAASVKIAE